MVLVLGGFNPLCKTLMQTPYYHFWHGSVKHKRRSWLLLLFSHFCKNTRVKNREIPSVQPLEFFSSSSSNLVQERKLFFSTKLNTKSGKFSWERLVVEFYHKLLGWTCKAPSRLPSYLLGVFYFTSSCFVFILLVFRFIVFFGEWVVSRSWRSWRGCNGILGWDSYIGYLCNVFGP